MRSLNVLSILLMFWSCSTYNAVSQIEKVDERPIFFSMNIERGKLDFFHNIQANISVLNALEVESSIGVNLTKTYFQRSFAPQFSLGFGYDVLKDNFKWKLMPMVKSRLTVLDLTSDLRMNYIEGLVGYSLIYGKKWKIVQGTFVGRGIESSNITRVGYWTWAIHLGLGYEF